ncbi:MAG: PAS domain S-box protein, partial [Candidatus Lokiarchaeota archaeon]|nr:PAS domain S-box protein [Candidatus Lokiarchaeota archaeon]
MLDNLINILLIEDNPGDARLIEEMLKEIKNLKFNLVWVETLKDGFKRIDDKNYDVILLDLNLPDSFGLDTVFKTCEKVQNIPIIVLTVNNDFQIGVEAVKAGIQDYLIKNEVSGNQLLRSIQYAIERNRTWIKMEKLTSQIQKSEEKYQFLINSSPIGVGIADLEGNILAMNKKMQELTGFTLDELNTDRLISTYVVPNERKILLNKLQETKKVHNFEVKLKKKDGTVYTALLNVDLIELDGKNVLLTNCEDITERKNTEKKRKESEEKFRYLFENSPNSIILLNFEDVIIDCNNTTEKIFGYKKEELINKLYSQNPIIPPKYLPEITNKIKEIYQGEVPKPIEIQVYKKDGSPIWVNMQFALFKIGKKKFMQLIIQDITARKKSEKEIKELEKSLQEIHALNETAPLGIFLLNQKGEILKVNRETENLFNYNREELLTHNIYELFDPESIDAINKHYEEDIYDLSISNKVEALIKEKHGNLLYVEVSSTILRIEDQIIIQSFFSDINDRKNFEKNREMLFDQLLASLDIKSRFMATMSHELRTPLNAILGFSQLLLDGSYGDLNVDQQDFINDINSAGDHLLSLINSILDISKIEAGKLKLDMQKFDLNELIVEINAVIKPLYSNKNLEFKVEGINEQDCLIADPVRFKQIIYNILSNAFKFTEKGNVSLCGIQRIDHWEFQIKDTGVGIAKKDYDVVFREFG